jgi:hypothetical protein
MAKYSSVNTITNGSEAIFELKAVLKLAGWVVQRSSDGLTYNASGDQISHASTGAGGMENNFAWFVIRDPGDSHEWCFQRGTTNLVWRVKISPLDRFTGGSPDATTVSSATDEQVIHGGGTDGSPTFAQLIHTDSTYKFHIIAQSTAVGTVVPVYGFWAFTTNNGTGDIYSMICQDPLDPDTVVELQGTRANPTEGDPDPVVYYCAYHSNMTIFTVSEGGLAATSNFMNAFSRYNYDDEIFIDNWIVALIQGYYSAARYFQAPNSSNGIGQNPYNGADDLMPVVYARPISIYSTEIGYKGISKYMRTRGNYKDYPDTINLATDAMVYLNDLVVPWEDTTTPLV